MSSSEAKESVVFINSKVNDSTKYSTFFAELDYDRRYERVDWHDRILTTDLKLYDLKWQSGKNDLNLGFKERMDGSNKVIDIVFKRQEPKIIRGWKDVKVKRKVNRK